MSKIRSKDTKPEKILRSALHNLGYRFRIHKKDLPGEPDIVLSKYHTVIFVHGCFWHCHSECREGRIPSSNSAYWADKITKNVARDLKNKDALKDQGWKTITIWECEIERKLAAVVKQIKFTLESDKIKKSY